MKRILLLCAAALTVMPSIASAGLDLSWSACNRATPPGVGDLTFDCTNPSTHATLFGNFQPPTTVSGFFALDAVLDAQTSGAALPPFWHFETGGCNAAGLTLFDAKPEAQCPSADHANPWGTNGGSSDAFITAYGPGFGAANRGRLLITIARAASDPITLVALRNYYAFHLDLSPDEAGSCPGCATAAAVIWSSATLYSVTDAPVVITNPGLRSNIATLNGGKGGALLSGITPTSGLADGPVTVTIYGRAIASGASAKLAHSGLTDIPGSSTSVDPSGTSMTTTFDLTARPGGPRDVVVTNPGQSPVILPQAFEIQAAVRIYTVSPDHIGDFGNASLSITGSGFVTGAVVRLQKPGVTLEASATTVAPGGQSLTCTFLGGTRPLGLYDVTVSNPDGTFATLPQSLRVAGNLSLSYMFPTSAADSGSAAVTIIGTGFVTGATVALFKSGQSDIPGQSIVVFADGKTITTTFNLAGRAVGAWSLRVANPDTAAATLTDVFTIQPMPHITSIAPSRGSDTGPISCVISGDGFLPGLTVRLTKASNPSITGTGVVVAGDGRSINVVFDLTSRTPGFWNVQVVNASGLFANLVNGFEVRAGFRIYSINPQTGADSGTKQATIIGSSIDPAATAKLTRTGESDIVGTSTVVTPDSSQLTTTFDLLGRRPGLWNVLVRNPDGVTASLPGAFTILAVPHPTSIAPASGRDTGPALLTISGSSFETGASAELTRAGTPTIFGTGAVVAADGRTMTVSFDLLARPLGLWNVVVTNTNGLTSSLPNAFEILPAPHVYSITPDRAENTGVVSLRIDGREFHAGATARLHRGATDIVGTSVVVAGDGQSLTGSFGLSGATTGFWDVKVTNPDLAEGTLPGAFTIQGLGVLQIIPSHGESGSAVSVVITGIAFAPDAIPSLLPHGDTSIPAQQVAVSSNGTLISAIFDLSGRAPNLCDVRVQNPGTGTTVTLPNAFVIDAGSVTFPAGLDLSWSACNRAPVTGTDDVTLDCGNPAATATLFANFQPPLAMPGFITLDAVLDVQTAGASLPAFWHFEDGGCNAGGLTLLDAKPQAVCPDAQNGTPWGDGSPSDAFITAYAPGFGGANHARLLLTVSRASSNPFNLNGGANYYAFHLQVGSEGAGSCAGCSTPAQITWSSATLYGSVGSPAPIVVTGSGLRSNVVTLNGGPSGVVVASMSPSRSYPDGYLTAKIFGRGFLTGLTVALKGAGQPDIVAQAPSVSTDGRTITAVFLLTGAPPGLRTVEVTNPSGPTGRAENMFEVLSHSPVVQVIAPNGGEEWQVGHTVTLRWSATDDQAVTSVDFWLSRDAGFTYQSLGSGFPNDGFIPWTVSPPHAPQCYFKVVAHDAAGNDGFDISDASFAITDFATPTQLALFEGGWAGDRVEIRWRFADGADFTRVAVQRAESAQGPWSAIDAAIRVDGGTTVATDAGARADATYYYRLATSAPDGATRVFGPIVVAPAGLAAARESGITFVAPNPTAGAMRVGFALARAGAVRLSVMDVQGREVARLAQGEYPAGRFETAWNGRVGGQDAPMGVYFVRFHVGGVTMTRRLAVAR